MAEHFDPYLQWLGIRDPERPPNHYTLLGVQPFESDPDVLANAADRQMAHVRTFQTGRHAIETQQLLNELAAATVCLLNPARKAPYDAWLGSRQPASTPIAPEPPKPPPAIVEPAIPGRLSPGLSVLAAVFLATALVLVGLIAVMVTLPKAKEPVAAVPDWTVVDSDEKPAGVEAGARHEKPANEEPSTPAPSTPMPEPKPATPGSSQPAVEPPPREYIFPELPSPPRVAPPESVAPSEPEPPTTPGPKPELPTTSQPEPSPKATKDPVPDAPAQVKALERIHEADGGDSRVFRQAIDAVGQHYEVTWAEAALGILDQVQKRPRPPICNQAIVLAAISLADRALSHDEFDSATAILDAAIALASKARDATTRRAAAAAKKSVQERGQLFAAFQEAGRILAKTPDDAEANLIQGRYYCLVKDDWHRGSGLLAKGGDARLRELADAESRAPTSPEAMLALADGWYDARNVAAAAFRDQYRDRAAHWYRRAVDGLSGLTKTRVQKRLLDIKARQLKDAAGP
ncbi:MAG: hypothetical protein NTW96_07405 [Planctomycetia bacterium]|nr:hypothetical protein [Planctomycetia bacterium]